MHGDKRLQQARGAWFAALRAGAEAAQAAGWHPDADIDTLLAFSCAAAMGTATLLSDASWRDLFGPADTGVLADTVLDLIVHKSRTVPRRVSGAPRPTRRRRKAS